MIPNQGAILPKFTKFGNVWRFCHGKARDAAKYPTRHRGPHHWTLLALSTKNYLAQTSIAPRLKNAVLGHSKDRLTVNELE